MTGRSPYLDNPQRLADVIAAIQALSAYKFYKLEFSRWARRISGSDAPAVTLRWRKVFEDHPEFFRIDTTGEATSLVARRVRRRSYHVDLERDLTTEELGTLPPDERDNRISRAPLSPSEVGVLISAAVELHAQALAHRQSRKWWIPVLTALLSGATALIGAYIGTLGAK